MENNVDTIVLLDEEGNEVEFTVEAKFDIEGNEYVIVVAEGEEDAVALKIAEDEEGNDLLIPVEDEGEFALVSEAYEALFEEGYMN